MKGKFYLEKRTPEDLQLSRDYVNQEIAGDPQFVPAYVGLADYWAVAPDYLSVALAEALPNEKAAALKAIDIDGGSAAAHLARCQQMIVRRDVTDNFESASSLIKPSVMEVG
jgi:hypothetical protein